MVSTYLVVEGGLIVALIAAISLILAIAYTAGPLPLAYLGLGDLFVLLFFGPIATGGSYFLQTHTISLPSVLAGLGPGLLSTAILTVNNLRDVNEDAKAEKRTLVVRFGEKFGQWEYTSAILLSALLPCLWGKYLPLLILLPAIPLIRAIFHTQGSELNGALGKTALLLGIYTILYVI
jgi:1,4-dihydroxy-2-naphthoate octaprenyltransferase